MSTASQAKGRRSLFDSAIVRRASVDALRKLSPRLMMKNPVMFVVEVGSVLTSSLLISDTIRGIGHFRFDLPDHAVALVYRAFRQLCRGHGGGPRKGPGGRSSTREIGDHRLQTPQRRNHQRSAKLVFARRRPGQSGRRPDDSRRRRGHGRRGFSGRVGHHR